MAPPLLSNILITGGMGFVGSAIVSAILEKHPDCNVTIFDLSSSISRVSGEKLRRQNVRFVEGDIEDIESVRRGFEVGLKEMREENEKGGNWEVVIHTAGIVPPLRERYHRRVQKEVWKTNVEGTKNVLEVAREMGIGGLVYTSSCCAVIDDWKQEYANIDERWPTSNKSSIYGESKAEAEKKVLAANSREFPTCILRPSVLMGPGDYQLVPSIHACIAKSETPFIIGNADNLWDVTYVTNIADAHVLAAENLVSKATPSAAGECFFIQNNTPITFRDFSLAIWKEFNHYPPFEITIPENLAWFAGLLAEMASWVTGSEFPTLSRGSVNDACAMRYASGEKALRILGYEPRVGLEEGIKLSCEDLKRRLEGKVKWNRS